MLRLSIVIPAAGRLSGLEDTMVSVLENRPDHCEIIVPNDGSYADPYSLSDEVSFVPVPKGLSWLEMVNLGVQTSRGATVNVLYPGVAVKNGWSDEATERLAADLRIGALAVKLSDPSVSRRACYGVTWSFGGHRRLVRSLKRTGHTWGPHQLAGFYRRTSFEAIGGFDTSVPTAADLDLAQRLASQGFRTESVEVDVHVPQHLMTRNGSAFATARDDARVYARHRAAGHHRIPLAASWVGWFGGCLRSAPWHLPSRVAGTLWGVLARGPLKSSDSIDGDHSDSGSTVPYPDREETSSSSHRRSA